MTEELTQIEDVEEVWEDLVEEVREEENRLIRDGEIERKADVASMLERTPERWNSGIKSLRTLPVLNALEQKTGRKAGREIQALAGFDAYINNLDDIIDEKFENKSRKVPFAANIAFSGLMAFGETPDEIETDVRRHLTKYLTQVFQIPLEEKSNSEELKQNVGPFLQNGTERSEEVKDLIEKGYDYRARDILGYFDMAAAYFDIDPDEGNIREDLKALRARNLISKDVDDINRDLDNEDYTPVMILTGAGNPAEAHDILEDVYDRFEYSDSDYEHVLESHERGLAGIKVALRNGKDAMYNSDN